MASALTATQLLLNALRLIQTPDGWESERIQAHVDWHDLTVRAIVLGLAPQLYRRLSDWQLDMPPRTAAMLKATYEAHAQRNAAIYRQLAEVLAACAERDLRPIALKGVHLAATKYSDAALRPMNDIDLLFMPRELSAVEAMLQGLAYIGTHKDPDLGAGVTKHTSTFRRANGDGATPNPYLSSNADRTIEPHTSLEESWFGLRIDITHGIRERAVDVTLGGQPCLALANEDLLLHICVHYCFHLIMGAPSLVQLVDILAITQAGDIDWDAFAARAIERRAAPFVLAALTQAQNLLDAPLPNDTLSWLADATPAMLRRRIAQLSLNDIMRRTQQKPLVNIRQRLVRGIQDRAETARWASDWRGRWRVWKTALQFGRTDTGRMLLGK